MQLPPRLAWYALLAAAVLAPLAVGVVPISGVPLTLNAFVQPKLIVMCLTLGVGLAAWALTMLREHGLRVGRSLVPLAVFLAVAAVSAAAAVDRRIAVFGDFEQGVGLLVFLLGGLTCFLTVQLVRDAKALRKLTDVVVFTAAGVAVIGLLQQALALDLVGLAPRLSATAEWMIQRGYGTIGNPDSYAAYLVLPAVLAIHRMRHAHFGPDAVRWGAAYAAILASCVMAQTRGPIVGLALGTVAYLIDDRRRARKAPTHAKNASTSRGVSPRLVMALVIGAIGVGVLGAFAFGTANDFAQRFFSVESLASLGGRAPLWESALRIAEEHPVLGVGPDSFRLAWYPTRQIAHLTAGAGLVITDPHSVPLLLAATTGAAGLLAAAFLLVSTLVTAFKTARTSVSKRGEGSDYTAWLYGFVALAIAMLAGMLTSVLAFMLFLAIGVLLAPTAGKVDLAARRAPGNGLRAAAAATGVALVLFGVLSSAAQITATGSQTDDAVLAHARASRAAALAPWDTGLRDLRDETAVQSALQAVFTQQPDAASAVDEVAGELSAATVREPYEYLHHYRLALLLIGSGQQLGAERTQAGIEAGLRGLDIYPNSVELRTGIASGYVALDQPSKAEELLDAYWKADPAYFPAGQTYVEALLAQRKGDAADGAVSVLEQRFPALKAVRDLRTRVSTESGV